MGLASLIGGLLSPVAKIIDDVHTSKEEKLQARAEVMMVQLEVLKAVGDFESKLLEAQSAVIVAEAKSQSWLARNWRPLLMLVFITIIANNFLAHSWFGIERVPIPDQMWGLLKIGVGGYIIARSSEKIAPDVIKIFKERK